MNSSLHMRMSGGVFLLLARNLAFIICIVNAAAQLTASNVVNSKFTIEHTTSPFAAAATTCRSDTFLVKSPQGNTCKRCPAGYSAPPASEACAGA